MGKKKHRAAKTSKGQRPSINSGLITAISKDVSFLDKSLNKLAAWKKGQNPWITVPTTEKNRPFVKIKANVLLGNPKEATYNIYRKPEA